MWGLARCPTGYRTLLSEALSCYGTGVEMLIEPTLAVAFAREMLHSIEQEIKADELSFLS